MSTPDIEPAVPLKLRRDAETRLTAGAAPATLGWSLGVNALALIHKLGSSPTSAPDALKLLHEVQVHQVELDLQHEQIETTQRELGDELAHYRELYERAPVGYLTLGSRHDVLECNLAAANLFGVRQDEVAGRDFASFLAPASRPLIQDLLKRLPADGSSDSCEAQLVTGGTRRQLQVVASLLPGGRSFLVVFVGLTRRE
jgi:PAS domain S-box-containing protein